MKKLNQLLNDGKVFVGMKEYESFKNLLDDQKIPYYAFDVDSQTVMVELEMEEN